MLTRSITRVLALLLVFSLALPLADMTTSPAIAKNNHRSAQVQKSKQVHAEKSKTATFTNAGAITIPAGAPTTTEGPANPFPSTIQASGFKKGKIQDVNVTINGYSHTFPDDVGILVQAPNGDTAILMANAGDGNPGVTNLTITFDDDTPTLIPDATAPTSGTFHPSVYDFPSNSTAPYVPLQSFNGSNPNGTWNLFVFDDSGTDVGSISGGWSLTIQATIAKEKKKHHKKHH